MTRNKLFIILSGAALLTLALGVSASMRQDSATTDEAATCPVAGEKTAGCPMRAEAACNKAGSCADKSCSKGCKCDDCTCDPCECGKACGEACKCETCKCDPCKCGKAACDEAAAPACSIM